jgi:hypothetical protein
MYKNRDSHAPTDEDLNSLGLEQWQINEIRNLSIELQWYVYHEFFRRLMSDEDLDGIWF